MIDALLIKKYLLFLLNSRSCNGWGPQPEYEKSSTGLVIFMNTIKVIIIPFPFPLFPLPFIILP